MRTIERASAFKRDYKKVISTPHDRKDVDALLVAILGLLLKDHAFSGERERNSQCASLSMPNIC